MLLRKQWPPTGAEFTTVVDGTHVRPWIAADAAYPLQPSVIVPFKGVHLPDQKELFNYCLSSNRMRVENTIGIIVRRFPILRQEFRFSSELLVNQIIVACCILHNLCIDWGDYDFTEDEEDEIQERFQR